MGTTQINLKQNNFIKSLLSAGNDALSNLFYVQFSGGVFGEDSGSLSQSFTVRCKDFNAPDVSQDSYKIKFLNATIERPASKVNITRKISLTFRVDAYYTVYEKLLEQQHRLFNISDQKTLTDSNIFNEIDTLFNINVYAYGGIDSNINEEGTLSKISGSSPMFTFKNCWISSLSLSEYSTENSKPVEVTAEINFIEMENFFEDFNIPDEL